MNQIAVDNDLDEKPLDPAVERVRRRMMRLLIVSISIMMIGLMAVLVAIVYRTGQSDGTSSAAGRTGPAVEAAIELPNGARVLGQSVGGEFLSIHVELPGGEQSILVYSTQDGRPVGRYAISFAAPSQ